MTIPCDTDLRHTDHKALYTNQIDTHDENNINHKNDQQGTLSIKIVNFITVLREGIATLVL